MQNPQAMAALQERLESASHTPSTIMDSIPIQVKRRVNALKQLQVKCAHIEAKFYEEVHELERKYAAIYQPLFDKRREVVTGSIEPTDEECEWHSEGEEEDELAEDMKKKATVEENKEDAVPEEDLKGIPGFWITIFRNVDILSDLVHEHDEPILNHLQDIKVKFSDPGQPLSFTLEFLFEPNDFFNNAVLTKVYKMKSEPDQADPFSFEGPEIVDCEGSCRSHSAIEWFSRLFPEKKRLETCFLRFYNDVYNGSDNGPDRNNCNVGPVSGDGEALDEDSEFSLAEDFEIGHFFRERIIPRAVLYFTGEAIEDDDDNEDVDEDEEYDPKVSFQLD
ncbi:UNVERIFIED_CONTAM: hypothetical protein FKN15_017565 [Acipenser sinensis]